MMKPRTKIDRSCNNNIITHYKTITNESGGVLVGSRYCHYKFVSYDHITILKEPNSHRFYYWYIHKVGAPAYIDHLNNMCWWYIKGERFIDTTEYCVACGFNKIKTMQWVLKYGTTLPTTPDEV